MKITKNQLKQIIKEEIATSIHEESDSWGPTAEDPELVAIDKFTSALEILLDEFETDNEPSKAVGDAMWVIRNMSGLIGRVVRLAPEQEAKVATGIKGIFRKVGDVQRETGGYERDWQERDFEGAGQGKPKAYAKTGTGTSVDARPEWRKSGLPWD